MFICNWIKDNIVVIAHKIFVCWGIVQNQKYQDKLGTTAIRFMYFVT